ncbi:MAG TPA: PIG-L family deacetylase [Chloroflexi bacterium]|nr:MAG: PIG-L family deacetylase [Anaerolineaceae bacterium 4572_5.2]HEY86295.1 PIG-L family deacetylase [Chloroflexota bacterium]
MKLNNPEAELFIPDGAPEEEALARTTHLGIGAHQDDLEIMAVDGILQCYQQPNKWFTGVVMTNGRGSARSGFYADYTDDEMRDVRLLEQKKAAFVGDFAVQFLLDYASSQVKDPANKTAVADLINILKAAKPKIVYTHNLADKHDTHMGVTLKTIAAIRALPAEDRPEKLYGCEVWRDLDWTLDEDKVAFDVSEQENLQMALVGVFDSQVAGGKRYDLATMGRRRANATYFASHSTDEATGLAFALDLTPLIANPEMDITQFIMDFINRFAEDVRNRIEKSSR